MNIGYEPVIAYCHARISDLELLPMGRSIGARIDELKTIVVLCEGLQNQFAMVDKALGLGGDAMLKEREK